MHLEAYATALAQQGYARHSIRTQVVVIAELSLWLQHKHIPLQDLDGKVVDRFLRHRQRHNRVSRGDAGILARFLARLGQTGAVERHGEPAVQGQRQNVTNQFRRYLLQERGLSTATLQNYIPFIDQFLSERFRNKRLNLSKLRAADITGFVQRHAHRLSPGTGQTAGDGPPIFLSLPAASRRNLAGSGWLRADCNQLVEVHITQVSPTGNGRCRRSHRRIPA